LVNKKGFGEERVISGLKRIKGKEQKGFQSSLSQFFGKPTITKRAPSPTKGKGVKKGLLKKKWWTLF